MKSWTSHAASRSARHEGEEPEPEREEEEGKEDPRTLRRWNRVRRLSLPLALDGAEY